MSELAKKNLMEFLKECNQNLPSTEIKKIIFSILSGLQNAHEKGIVHRDIKPANVLVTESGTYKLCHWGISRKMMIAKETLSYIPPEILKYADGDISKVNLFKADAYSAGLLFLICCGLPEDELQYIHKSNQAKHDKEHLEHLNEFVLPKIPEIKELMSNLTCFDSESRFDVSQALKFWAQSKIINEVQV